MAIYLHLYLVKDLISFTYNLKLNYLDYIQPRFFIVYSDSA